MEQVTLSVEQLRELISDEVQKAVEHTKPVRDSRMKELELYFRDEVSKKKLSFNWYTAWNAVRTTIALKMGYPTTVKVPAGRYDEFLETIRKELDEVIKAQEAKA